MSLNKGLSSLDKINLEFPYTCIVYKPDPNFEYYEARKNIGRKYSLLKAYDDPNVVIQKALENMTQNRTWIEKILFKGKFLNVDQIKLPNYTHLVVEGLIKAKAGMNNHSLITNEDHTNGNHHIIIEKGYFDGNKEQQNVCMDVIELVKSYKCKILDCWVRGAKRDIDVQDFYGEGIDLRQSCHHIIVKGVHALENDYDGIKVRNSSYECIITNNVCLNNGASGVQAAAYVHKVLIANNIIRSDNRWANPDRPYCRGVTLHQTYNCVVRGNSIENVHKGILILGDSNQLVSDNIFTSNKLRHCQYGIYLQWAGNYVRNIFNNNSIICVDREDDLIAFYGAENNIFSQNLIKNNQFYNYNRGIIFNYANHKGNIIDGNFFNNIEKPWDLAGINEILRNFGGFEDYLYQFSNIKYVETDPNDRITISRWQIDFDSLSRSESAYVYKDKGIDYFEDFTHRLALKITSASGWGIMYPWGLANDIGDFKTLEGNGETVIAFQAVHDPDNNQINLYLREDYGSNYYLSSKFVGSLNKWYYIKITKDGTNLEAKIYDDDIRSNLLATLSLTLHADHKFRYLYVISTHNTGSGETISGIVKQHIIDMP
mgnify:CR=1 FL=1